jgi:ribosome-associated protein
MSLDLGHGVRLPEDEVELRTSRSSGPGGQHANVSATRVQASFDVMASPTLTDEQKRRICARLGKVVTAVAQDTRSQARNRDLALERLRTRLSAALAVRRPRRATKPGRAARERRLQSKRREGEKKRLRRPPGADA